MKVFSYNVRLPSLTAGILSDAYGTPAIITVNANELVLKPEGHPHVVLSPDEVVDFRVDGSWPIVVEHVAFDKVGNVSFSPDGLETVGYSGLTCRDLLESILATGFQPRAKPGIPWFPGQPFPSCMNDANAQCQLYRPS